MIKYGICLSVLVFLFGCASQNIGSSPVYETKSLLIEPITKHTFLHVSYLQTQSFGNVACNGMVYRHKNKAIVFDTPTNDSVSLELIHWIENTLHCKVIAVVVNHFHEDCVGGLAAFHRKGIPSYANNLTKELTAKVGFEQPQIGFDSAYVLTIGNQQVVNCFYGAAHAPDNIVSYVPNEKVLFGGCMVKALGASKGNLSDANLQEWTNTIYKIKKAYPDVKIVVPGHGKIGGVALLDFTADLFKVGL